jgi:hypothetical protein
MTIEQEYTTLLEQNCDGEIISFFQGRSLKERGELAPLVKKLAKEYFTYQQHGNTWTPKATEPQRQILNVSFFVCYDKKDFYRENPAWLLSREYLDKILPWYCPAWLNDYVNRFADNGWLPFGLDYGYLMELTDRGFIKPLPQLIARTLVPAIYVRNGRQTFFSFEKLLKYPDTLHEHIWYLFQFETDVHISNRWLYGLDQKEQRNWTTVFVILEKEGRLNRQRVLKESLLSANRNFSKNLSGWFADLFWRLEPAAEEVVSLQAEISNMFSSPHSKVVNAALQACKLIQDSSKFNVPDFLDYVPVLLASDTKQVVTATLQILEKLAKDYPRRRNLIVELATGALIHREEDLQMRAAKLIRKWGGNDDEDLRQTIMLHDSNLFSKCRDVLQSFLSVENDIHKTPSQLTERNVKAGLSKDTALPIIGNVDELVFLAAQAFDNNESWHIDLLPDALVRLNNQLKGEHIVKLEPSIQRALKLFFGDWRSTQGALDQLLACFFLDYCLWFIGQYPEHAASPTNLFRTFMHKSEQNKKVWEEHGVNTSFMAGWKSHGEELLYQPYQQLLNTVLANLKNRQELPLLSTPTHAPAWIDPVVLSERVYRHHQQAAPPDNLDLQIAISRCWLDDTKSAIQFVRNNLTGEWRALMLFLLDQNQRPVGPFTHEPAWMVAALSKTPGEVYPELAGLVYSGNPRELYTGEYSWKTFIEAYEVPKNDWKEGKVVTTTIVTHHRKVLRLDLSAQETKAIPQSGFKKLIGKLLFAKPQTAKEPSLLIYDYLRIKSSWSQSEYKDIRRLFLLIPRNPGAVLALTVHHCLNASTFYGEENKRFVLEVLKAVHETGMPSGEIAHLFLATCMTSSDKTVAKYAAEIWMQGVDQKTANSGLIGTILGKHQHIEFAPTKRFTDLVVTNMLGLSEEHNRQLETMLAFMLKQLPSEPVKGLKKLLHLYFEVVRINASSIDPDVRKSLESWKPNDALNKVLKAV